MGNFLLRVGEANYRHQRESINVLLGWIKTDKVLNAGEWSQFLKIDRWDYETWEGEMKKVEKIHESRAQYISSSVQMLVDMGFTKNESKMLLHIITQREEEGGGKFTHGETLIQLWKNYKQLQNLTTVDKKMVALKQKELYNNFRNLLVRSTLDLSPDVSLIEDNVSTKIMTELKQARVKHMIEYDEGKEEYEEEEYEEEDEADEETLLIQSKQEKRRRVALTGI